MANNFTKTMRQALQEAREYRDTTEGGPGSGPQKGGKKFSSSEIKKAYGILNDPRYKQGNYTGAAKAINKLAPGLADHPDVKNAMKRANENLDLPATGDTTTSNASQEVEQVEDLKEYTGMSISKSVNSNDVATALKNLKKGTKLYVQGKSQGGMRTMGDVISVSGDTVKIKPTASNGPTSVKVKDITMMDTLKEELDEARFTPAQISALQKAYAPLKGKTDYKSATGSKMNFNKLKNKMKSYSVSHLQQLSVADIPMVSDAAKELMKEEVAEGGPGSGPQKGGVKKPKKSGLDTLKIPGASKHMPADKSKKVSMAKTPAKFGGDYYDQEDREELAYFQKVNTNKQPAWKLKKYGVTADGELAKGWKPDDQLKG